MQAEHSIIAETEFSANQSRNAIYLSTNKKIKKMALLKLTERISKGYGSAEFTTQTVLIETNQIIRVETKTMKSGNAEYEYTKIESVGAMVAVTHVTETPEEIFKMYQKQTIKI